MNKSEQTIFLSMNDLLHRSGHNMTESALKIVMKIVENYHVKPKTLLAINNLKHIND